MHAGFFFLRFTGGNSMVSTTSEFCPIFFNFVNFFAILFKFCALFYTCRRKKILHGSNCGLLTREWWRNSRTPDANTKAPPAVLQFWTHPSPGWRDLPKKQRKMRQLSAIIFLSTEGQIWCSTNTERKIVKFWKIENIAFDMPKIGLDALTQAPPPLLVPEQGRGTIGWQSHRSPMPLSNFMQSHRSPMPLSNFMQSHRSPMPLWKNVYQARQAAPSSLMRGLCWNHRFRPSCACVLPLVRAAGPLLEPLVPPLVLLRAAACEQNWTKFVLAHVSNKISQNFVDRNVHKYEENWTQKQQNSTKFCWPGHAKTRRKLNAKTTKFHKILLTVMCQNTKKTARKNNKIPQNFVDRNVPKHEENCTQKQQNFTKFCWQGKIRVNWFPSTEI